MGSSNSKLLLNQYGSWYGYPLTVGPLYAGFLYIGLMPWMALRTSRVRSWPRPLRWRQMSAIPAAPAIIGILMHAPRRCLLGKIGSSPMKVIEPPVSSGESPSSCITARNSALMSKAETFGVAKVLVLMWIPLRWLLSCDSQTLRPLRRRDCCAQQRHPRLARKQESHHRHARRRAYIGPTNP